METNKVRRILILTFVFSPNMGGVETHLDDLVKFLLERGHTITVLTYKTLGLHENVPFVEKKKNLTVIRIPWFHPWIFNTLETLPFLQILYLVPPIFIYSIFYLVNRRKNFDIIQVHGFNMAIVGSILSKIFKLPFVVNTHVSFYLNKSGLYAKMLLFFLKNAVYILVLTEEAQKNLIEIGINKKKIRLYYYWINEKIFKPLDKQICRTRLGIRKNLFVILFVGRFSPAKGISILTEAAVRLGNNACIMFVGSGPLASHIKEKTLLSDSIKFVGRIAQKDLPVYYSSADIVIIPSTPVTKRYSEGIPRVIIESYSCGIPVIATATGGINEHITPLTGFIIRPTQESIRAKIQSLMVHRQILKSMRSQCIDYSTRTFSQDLNGSIIEKSLL